MRRQEVRKQSLEARFTELASQVRQLEKVVEIVDRMAERADFTELLLCVLEMLLNFFELRESFFYVLSEFQLHLLRDRHQLRVHAIANRIETLGGLLIQALKFALELLRGQQERRGHLAAAVAQTPVLLFPSRGKLLLDRAPNL